jgi:hypothetical protein
VYIHAPTIHNRYPRIVSNLQQHLARKQSHTIKLQQFPSTIFHTLQQESATKTTKSFRLNSLQQRSPLTPYAQTEVRAGVRVCAGGCMCIALRVLLCCSLLACVLDGLRAADACLLVCFILLCIVCVLVCVLVWCSLCVACCALPCVAYLALSCVALCIACQLCGVSTLVVRWGWNTKDHWDDTGK